MAIKKPTPKPTAKVTIKPTVKATPKATTKSSLPSVEDYRKSAAFKTNSMSYKEYLDIAKAQQSAKAKANKTK